MHVRFESGLQRYEKREEKQLFSSRNGLRKLPVRRCGQIFACLSEQPASGCPAIPAEAPSRGGSIGSRTPSADSVQPHRPIHPDHSGSRHSVSNFRSQKSGFRLRPQTSDLNFQPQKSSFKPSGLKLSVSSAQFQTSGLKPSSLRHDTRLSARCSMPCRPESARTGIRPNRRDGPQCRSSDTAAADQ